MPTFNKIQLGDKANLSKTIAQEDFEIFADLSGDRNALHFDPVYTKEKIEFKVPVAHGVLTIFFILGNEVGNV